MNKDTTKKKESTELFSNEEKQAMKDYVAEKKAAKSGKKTNGEADVQAKLDAMTGTDKEIGTRLHALIKATAPELTPRTWYGMPAYSNKEGKTICFFRPAKMFKERYITFGFNQEANLDEGNLWPIVFALTKLTAVEEKKVVELVKKALS